MAKYSSKTSSSENKIESLQNQVKETFANYISSTKNYIIQMKNLEDFGFENDHDGIGHAIFDAMNKNKYDVFLIDCESDNKFTYKTILTNSKRVALYMQSKELKSEDIVSVCTNNCVDAYIPFIAAMFLGVQFSFIDRLSSSSTKKDMLKQLKPKILFVDEESVTVCETFIKEMKLNTHIIVFSKCKTYVCFEDIIETEVENEANFLPVTKNANETAAIVWTAGSTANPKGICLHHYGLYAQAFNYFNTVPEYKKVCLHFCSLSNIIGLRCLLGTILGGNRMLVVNAFNQDSMWELIPKYRATFLFLTNVQAMLLEKYSNPSKYGMRSLKLIMFGGGSFAKDTYLGLRKMWPKVTVLPVYLLSEAGGYTASYYYANEHFIELAYSKPEFSGMPMLGFAYKVINMETGDICRPNEKGELCIKGRMIMNSYVNSSEKSIVDKDGWLHTGDFVFFDEDFCFNIVDRCKQMLKMESSLIAPSWLESIIMDHPAIDLAMATAAPDNSTGNHLLAVVTLNSGQETITGDEIAGYVEDQVEDAYKVKGDVSLISKFPITDEGNSERQQIEKMIKKDVFKES